ncbi:MAG: hypothetical protein KH047_06135 [Eubacterium sp.]|nr:hypothetical protein [Eubacterium sp.]
MAKEIILGIDFSKDNSQIAYIDDMGKPQSVSMGTANNYLIPTVVCYNDKLDEWSAGEEAINKSRYENSQLYTNLPEMFEQNVEKEQLENVMKAFFSYLIKCAVNNCNGRLIKNILITVEEVNPTILNGLMEIMESLGYGKDDVKIISHSESFVYYTLNQNKDIWINKVLFLELNQNHFFMRMLEVVKGRKPYVADVSMEDLSYMINLEMVQKDVSVADQILAEYMDEMLKTHVVSGIYLSGEGFYVDGWQKTLQLMCRNRRVFKGNNLIVKGAAYGAKEEFLPSTLDQYLISCKGRTRVKIAMAVEYKGKDSNITLSNIGDYWYNARSKFECIMEKPVEAVFEIQDLINHTNDTFKIDLRNFPKREPNTTRIQVEFKYVEENKFEITITDLGFGEFFESSGMVVKKEITLQ